jgi:hypothetical protein
VGYSPDSKYVSTEAEESPLLEAVARERLVKGGCKRHNGAVVICEFWRSTIVLELFEVPSGVYK